MKIIAVKNYSLRKNQFNISTFFIKNNNIVFVRKKINHYQARTIINNLYKSKDFLKKELVDIKLVEILKRGEDYIDFQYLDLPSFEYLIEKSLIERNFYKAENYFDIFLKYINKQKVIREIEKKEIDKFQSIFNPKKGVNLNETFYLKSCLYDLNLDNFLYDENKNLIYLVDWEWLFDFPVPLNLVIFRVVFYLSLHLQSIIQTFCNQNFQCYEIMKNFYIPKIFWEKLNFTPKQVKQYLILENNFQNYVNKINQKFNYEHLVDKFNLQDEKIKPIESFFSQSPQINQNFNLKNPAITVLKNQLFQTQAHIQNLETQLNTIKSAKAFKLWQWYCRIRDKFLRKINEKK